MHNSKALQTLRTERVESPEGLTCVRVFGLNIFSANRVVPREFKEEEQLPYVRFLTALCSGFGVWGLVGWPAIENWANDIEAREQRRPDPREVLGIPLRAVDVEVSFYDGQFFFPETSARSSVVEVKDEARLLSLIENFLGWDALALLVVSQGTRAETIASSLGQEPRKSQSHEDIITQIARRVQYLVTSQGEGQYLEVFTRAGQEAQDRISVATTAAEEFVIKTQWFRSNKDKLVWSDLEHAYVARARLE